MSWPSTAPRFPSAKFPSGRAPRGDNGVEKLIIDPATFTLRADSNYEGTVTILAAGWTNNLPTVARAGKVPTPNSGNG